MLAIFTGNDTANAFMGGISANCFSAMVSFHAGCTTGEINFVDTEIFLKISASSYIFVRLPVSGSIMVLNGIADEVQATRNKIYMESLKGNA